jgi:hypothetical protein
VSLVSIRVRKMLEGKAKEKENRRSAQSRRESLAR